MQLDIEVSPPAFVWNSDGHHCFIHLPINSHHVTLDLDNMSSKTMRSKITFFSLVTLTFKVVTGIIHVHALTKFHDPRSNTF